VFTVLSSHSVSVQRRGRLLFFPPLPLFTQCICPYVTGALPPPTPSFFKFGHLLSPRPSSFAFLFESRYIHSKPSEVTPPFTLSFLAPFYLPALRVYLSKDVAGTPPLPFPILIYLSYLSYTPHKEQLFSW